MKHSPNAGSIARAFEMQSGVPPLCYGCPQQNSKHSSSVQVVWINTYWSWRWDQSASVPGHPGSTEAETWHCSHQYIVRNGTMAANILLDMTPVYCQTWHYGTNILSDMALWHQYIVRHCTMAANILSDMALWHQYIVRYGNQYIVRHGTNILSDMAL